MQQALTPRASERRRRAGSVGHALATCGALLMSCGEVIDVSDPFRCPEAGYWTSKSQALCDSMRVQPCSYQSVGDTTRIEPLDCREGVGYLADPTVVHVGCASALVGRSGQRCGAEFMCAQHTDDSCCVEVASCSFAHSLLRSRACIEGCSQRLPDLSRLPLRVAQATSCAELAARGAGVSLSEAPSLVVPCSGALVCGDDFADLSTPQPLPKGLARANFCVGGVLQQALFLDVVFAPVQPSNAPPVLSSRKPDSAR